MNEKLILKVILWSRWDSSNVTNDTCRYSGISTRPKIAVGTLFYAQRGSKTIPVILPAKRKACWLLLATECHKRQNALLSFVDKAVEILQTDWLRWTIFDFFFRTDDTKERQMKFNFEVSVKIFIHILWVLMSIKFPNKTHLVYLFLTL